MAPEIEISEEMILEHWELEKNLTKELLKSNSENRWEVFEQAYTTLYSKIEWLKWQNSLPQDVKQTQPGEKYKAWLQVIGSPPQKIYEVGSGKAEIISYFAKCGFECKATEITRERGSKHITDPLQNLSWGNSDGVHLDNFEPTEFYDLVISSQVIEHFHPDDLIIHLKSAHKILKNEGKYIFSTPHRHTGPHDISSVFGCDKPQGMHLKEYTYRELKNYLIMFGYKLIYSAGPAKFAKQLSKIGIDKEQQIIKIGVFYLNLMLIVENIIFAIPSQKIRRSFSKSLRKIYLFSDNIFLVAQK
jgi:SAM-dependent methyltransferase